MKRTYIFINENYRNEDLISNTRAPPRMRRPRKTLPHDARQYGGGESAVLVLQKHPEHKSELKRSLVSG